MRGLTLFGKAVQKMLVDRNLSMTDLSESTGIGQNYLSRICRGRGPVSSVKVQQISEALKATEQAEKELIIKAHYSNLRVDRERKLTSPEGLNKLFKPTATGD